MKARSGLLDEIHARSGPAITAHRGLSGSFPENTLEAFEQAVACGADLVEFDVRLTADRVPIVLHDPTVDRTTDGHGAVAGMRLAEVRELNASYWSGAHSTGRRLRDPARPDARIPTLEATLALLAGRVGLNIQIKMDGGGFEAVTDVARRFHLAGSAYWMVANHDVAQAFRELASDVDCCVGSLRGQPRLNAGLGFCYLQPAARMVTPGFAETVDGLKLRAHVFYANATEDMDRLCLSGIAGVLTDHADRLVAHRARGFEPR